MKLSIVIKAYNEEDNIERAITSAISAAAPYGGEVILADSCSTDRTVERATRFPIAVIQLTDAQERCCGITPQLGYQHSLGEYIYLIDGDMELDPSFLPRAMEILDHEPRVAGVGGLVREMRTNNLEFENRLRRRQRERITDRADVPCLIGGGLYRRSAIEQAGYFSDRNLHAFEEYDLGARLRLRGWRLVRLKDHAIDHYGYSMDAYRLLWQRVKTGYFLGIGEILRAAWSNGYLRKALFELRTLRVYALDLALWVLVLAGLAYGLWTGRSWVAAMSLAVLILPILAMSAVSGSLERGVYSVVTRQVFIFGLLRGLVRSRRAPDTWVDSRIIQGAQGSLKAG